jgi:hypothetical protein
MPVPELGYLLFNDRRADNEKDDNNQGFIGLDIG